MSTRLTPTTVAEREIARCQSRIDRLEGEKQAVITERTRWERVLEAMNGHEPDPAEAADRALGEPVS